MTQETVSALHDAYAAGYDNQVQAYDCHIAEVLFGLCSEFTRRDQRLLDLGIGSGLSAELFAKAGLDIFGMDFSEVMLELCRAKGIAKELKLRDLQQAPWPYPPNEFDHLVCCGVFHFIPDLEIIFDEAARVARKGGIFAFSTKDSAILVQHPRKYDHQNSGGFDIFSHSTDYISSLLIQNLFKRLKTQKCFVGEEVFTLWIVKKGMES